MQGKHHQKQALRELETIFSSDLFPRTIALTMIAFDRLKRGETTPEDFFADGLRGLLLCECTESGLDNETAIAWTATLADQSVELAMAMVAALDISEGSMQ
ncbi:hypothetical protein OIV19_03430 [Brucella sp. HL-2]|nr:hypothetical protein [Brucella sp. HL-2]MCV9906667.1 hypothetical protein [Brucella sp. HL-2]